MYVYVIINMVRFVSQLQLWLIEFKHLPKAIILSKFSYTPIRQSLSGVQMNTKS